MSNAASARPAARGYIWQIPGSSFRIHVGPDVVLQMQACFAESVLPRVVRRDDIQAFLLGDVNGPDVRVTGVEPWSVPDAGLTAVPSVESAIGHVRRLDEPKERDVVLLEFIVDAVGPLCLLLRIRPDGTVAASAPAPSSSGSHRYNSYIIASVLGAAVLGGSAIAVYLARQTPQVVEVPAHEDSIIPRHVIVGSIMSLSAVKGKGDVVITWNGNHPSLADARIGVLSIKDGDRQTELPLTRAQIQANRKTYVPRSNQLEIRLDVFSAAGKPTSDSMIVDLVSHESVRSRSAPVASDPGTTLRVRHIQTEERPAPPIPRAFVTPATAPAKAVAREAVLTDVPALQRVVQSEIAANKPPDFLPGTPLAPALAPPVAGADAPKQGAITNAPTRTLVVKPPAVIRRVRPEVPANILTGLRRRTSVQVRMTIDESGKVSKVEAQRDADPISVYLGNLATGAARQWIFEPGRRGDTPVKSEMVVEFVFGPLK